VIVDLSALEFIDCHALGALLHVQQAARAAGGDVLLAAPRQLVLRVLDLAGPCRDAAACAAPVLADDLDDAESGRRWPAFTPAARKLGAAAVFAFPLTIGAIRAGMMGLYRGLPGPLASTQLGDCLLIGDAATVLLLSAADHGTNGEDPAGSGGQPPDLALHRAEIDQATGMLTEQLGATITEAFARLRAYAFVQDRRLADVAGDIVARRLRLAPDPVPGSDP
jgi:hypothetical protein